jgi:hypothetical protein
MGTGKRRLKSYKLQVSRPTDELRLPLLPIAGNEGVAAGRVRCHAALNIAARHLALERVPEPLRTDELATASAEREEDGVLPLLSEPVPKKKQTMRRLVIAPLIME